MLWGSDLAKLVPEYWEEEDGGCHVPGLLPVRAVPAGAEALLARLQAPDGVSAGAEWTGRSGYAMVGIGAGRFTMGSPSSEKGRDDDEDRRGRVLRSSNLFNVLPH